MISLYILLQFALHKVELYGNIEDDEEGSDESSGDDDNTTSDESIVNSKGKSIDRTSSDLSDGDEGNDDTDNDEEEQGEGEEEEDVEDESFIEIDTEEVFEHIAKGKSYATFEGTYIQFSTVRCRIFFVDCTVHVVCCNVLYWYEGHAGGPHFN